MSIIRTATLAAVFVAMPLTAALAQTTACTAPLAIPVRPALAAPIRPTVPAKPACAASDKCGAKEGKAYNDEIAKYNAASTAFEAERSRQIELANTYIKALNSYGTEYKAYIDCERKAADTLLNGSQ